MIKGRDTSLAARTAMHVRFLNIQVKIGKKIIEYSRNYIINMKKILEND